MAALKKLIYSWVDKKFLNGCSTYNTLETRKSCRSKAQAREAFATHGIPHAKGTIFWGPFKALSFAKEHGFPICIKPNVSGFSRGSHFPIRDYKELISAILAVKVWWPTSVIEEYLEGRNYRIAVVKNDIMSLIRRYPPFVDGDGTSTISELIDKENAVRKEMNLYPVMHSISKSTQVERYLKKQNLTLESVPAKGQRVTVFNRVALAPGGIIETLDKESMHPENRELFLKLLPVFNANVLGIDAIFEKGIEHSYKEQKAIFLEVNSRPYMKMHDYPRYGEKQDLSSYYQELEKLDIKQVDIF
jgi:D-alanine-D-alanine ligase-like ATP-grasp enzyme